MTVGNTGSNVGDSCDDGLSLMAMGSGSAGIYVIINACGGGDDGTVMIVTGVVMQ